MSIFEEYGAFNHCHAEWIKMPRTLLILNQSDYPIHMDDINSHTYRQTVQNLQRPTDLDLQYLQRHGISGWVQQDSGLSDDIPEKCKMLTHSLLL